MRYDTQQTFRRHKPRIHRRTSFAWSGLVVFALIVLFVYAVYWFRMPEEQITEETDSIADILTPDPDMALRAVESLDTESKTAALRTLEGGTKRGEVKRGHKDDRYYLEIETDIEGPSIDREGWEYEVWLIRQVPYDFFSLGKMITNDLGLFIFEWEGETGKEYNDYTKILITLEPKDGNPDPSEKYLEGEFGE